MRKSLFFAALFVVSFTTFAQVGINTISPNPSAALDITSSSKGLLPPRMTHAEKINISVGLGTKGLMVYCTDCGTNGEPQYHNGAAWVNMAGNAAATGTGTGTILEVSSGTTGRIWMAHNLGASQVAENINDPLSFGDYYQWGRKMDGHQVSGSSETDNVTVSSTYDGNDFRAMRSNNNNGDWLDSADNNRWNSGLEVSPVKVTANDPCPEDFRVPTMIELNAEYSGFDLTDISGFFGSTLKLPLGGFRPNNGGAIQNVGTSGNVWSSKSGDNVGISQKLFYNSDGAASEGGNVRATGFPVRCIKQQ